MKTLLIFVAGLLCLSVRAASPLFSQFDTNAFTTDPLAGYVRANTNSDNPKALATKGDLAYALSLSNTVYQAHFATVITNNFQPVFTNGGWYITNSSGWTYQTANFYISSNAVTGSFVALSNGVVSGNAAQFNTYEGYGISPVLVSGALKATSGITYKNGLYGDLLNDGGWLANYYDGDGSGLTNLNGANIQLGTINSNKLDSATVAMFGGGGGGSGNVTGQSPVATGNFPAYVGTGGTTITNSGFNGTSFDGAGAAANRVAILNGGGTNLQSTNIFRVINSDFGTSTSISGDVSDALSGPFLILRGDDSQSSQGQATIKFREVDDGDNAVMVGGHSTTGNMSTAFLTSTLFSGQYWTLNASGFETTSLKTTNAASIGGLATVNGLVVTNGVTNQSLTASTVLIANANKKVSSVANAAGALTNDGAGGVGYLSLSSFGGSGGGGTTLNTNGFQNQTVLLTSTNTFVTTNVDADLGWPFIKPVILIVGGDSIMFGLNAGNLGPWYYWTNNYAPAGKVVLVDTNACVPGAQSSALLSNLRAEWAKYSSSNAFTVITWPWVGVNDFNAHVAYTTVLSNVNEAAIEAHASNSLFVGTCITPSTGMADSDIDALNSFNDAWVDSVNWDWLTRPDLHLSMTQPDHTLWVDDVHPSAVAHNKVARGFNYVIRHARRSTYYPYVHTASQHEVRGFATDPIGYAASLSGGGQYPGLDLYYSTVKEFYVIPFANSDGGTCDFHFNPANSTHDASTLFMQAQGLTNVVFKRLVTATGFQTLTNVAVAPASITFPGSTVLWTNTFGLNITLYIDNAGVTGTAISKNGQQIFSSLVGDNVLTLKPGDYFSETYTVGTPVGRWEPR